MIIGGGVDIEAADGLAVAVKGADVGAFLAVADWGPGISFLFATDLAEVDIVGELGVDIGVFSAIVVDFVSKFFQLLCGADVILAIVSLLQRSPLTTL